MITNELVNNFISHSPGFHKDIELSEIDDKHTNILREAYKQISSVNGLTGSNFRSWKAQNDLAVPAQVSFSHFRLHGVIKTILKYFYMTFVRYRENKFLISSLLDDVSVINNLGAEKLLIDNPVHLTPGVGNFYRTSGSSVNTRWLRYVYILKRILDMNLLKNGGVWVDIGCYYGGIQGLVRKYNPRSKLVLVDFHHQLCRSYIYLNELFPDAIHILPDEIDKYGDINNIPEGGIMYVPVSEYVKIKDQKADLVTNFFSLGEMRREFFSSYMDSKLFKESENIYLVNRVVSSPFFEKTYDTDVSILDYIKSFRKIKYFDLFPMHHYLLLKRKLFGRVGFRNVSSPYFEIITTKK